jgi:hypothetical protein
VSMHLQSIDGQTDCAADQGSVNGSGNDGASQTTALLERGHFYMKEENKTGRGDGGEHGCV